MKAPYCPKGSRRCPISKKCVQKSASKKEKCAKGTRKCADSKCYRRNKSVKSRKRFNKKYN